MTNVDASEQLAELVAKRDNAYRRVEQLEAEQRAAGQARAAARAALVEAERRGVTGAERTKLEKALADAERHAAERWPERLEGARHALRDTQAAVQVFTRDHLDDLVAAKEQEGELPTEKLAEHAQAILADYAERERIAGEIAQLVSTAGIRIRPGDVTFSRAEPLANAAREFLSRGGEERPRLRRDPRVPLAGAPLEAAAS
jgi:hypothetical protein